MCCYCKGDSIQDFTIGIEIFCRYECYDHKYDLANDEDEDQ